MLVLVAPMAGADQSWTVASIDADPTVPTSITLRLDGNQLLLNNLSIQQSGGSSGWQRTLLLTGVWGVCGAVGPTGILVPDPYATFVILADQPPPSTPADIEYPLPAWVDNWFCMGYVQWASETPEGYSTSLMIGADFAGNGAAAYHYEDALSVSDAVGTAVLDDSYAYIHGSYGVHEYTALCYSFTATHTPEPATLVAVIVGFGWLAALAKRTKRIQPGLWIFRIIRNFTTRGSHSLTRAVSARHTRGRH